MKIKKISAQLYICFILLMAVTVLGGCGATGEKNNTATGFDCIKELDYEGAIAAFEQGIEAGEDKRSIKRGEGIAYLALGQYDLSISAFEEALSLSNGILNGMDYDISYYLATALYKKGSIEEAIGIYDSILALKPNEVPALYLRGLLYSELDNLDMAMENFNKAISIAPNDYDMLIEIYTVLEQNGYKETGQTYLKSAIESDSKRMTNYEKGQISFYLEDYESARTYLEKAKDENGAEAVLFLGKTYEILGDTNYAISVYSSFINSGADSAEVLNQLGNCRMSIGDYEGALQAFEQAINIEDNGMMQTLKFNEIVACEYTGDFEKAKNLMSAYIKAYPNDEEAKREYTFLKTR